MLKMSDKNDLLPPQTNAGLGGVGGGRGGRGDRGGGGGEKQWELRPGGMLVQKRTDGDIAHVPPPTIRVRVKYGSIYHEIYISSQATFGELKKMLSGPTGLHHQDQKLFYKDKERDSNAFLDISGVKDKSKIVLQQSQISSEVDKLVAQVSALETVVSRGGKVVEKDVVNLTELLMNQLVKLDGITADGDAKHRDNAGRKLINVRRVQKCVETLDTLKLKNSAPASNADHVSLQQKHSNGNVPLQNSNGSVSSPIQQQPARHSIMYSLIDSPNHQQHPLSHSALGAPVVITTQWETFDPTPMPLLGAPSTSKTETITVLPAHQPSLTWDLL
ncbi:BAG family molecular chaperone regulator 1 [Sesamum angolense]|uniref:BAG family molecular chaperone regulator 1 n=1 Tax=Sesamum angolense TaxID=2727404 RepID=A0AAE2BZW9_9LAMI|nr:BAG family molecular chaperone regulator 1 [Sesamum angolense]